MELRNLFFLFPDFIQKLTMKVRQSLFISILVLVFLILCDSLSAQRPNRRRALSPEEIASQTKQIKDELSTVDSDTARVRLMMKLGRLIGMDNVDEGITTYKKAIELAKSAGNAEYLARSYFGAGNIYQRAGKSDEALEYFSLGMGVAKEMEDPKDLLGNFYMVTAQIYQRRGVYEKSLNYYHLAIDEFEREKVEPHRITTPYLMIGNILTRNENPSKSIFYFKKCIELSSTYGDTRKIMGAYHGLGNAYELMGQTDQANEAFIKSKELRESMEKKSTSRPSKK
jgi:tetratricopeptide (TPR) repeat protein